MLEFLFALVFGLPPLVAAFGALLEISVNPSAPVFEGFFLLGCLRSSDISDSSVCVLKEQEKEEILGKVKKSVHDVIGDYWMQGQVF